MVKDGKFQQEGITILNEAGTRNLNDNLSDLKAQIAAKNKGTELMDGLIKEYSLKVVQAYMNHIQNNAQQAVREMLQKIHNEYQEKKQSQKCGMYFASFLFVSILFPIFVGNL